MIIGNFPLNATSFGNCSLGVLNELYSRKYEDILISNIGKPDLSVFNERRSDQDFLNWLNARGSNFLGRYSRDFTRLSLWHINGSENSPSNNNVLWTFHELDSITPVEKNILNNQDKIIVNSQYTKDVFVDGGVTRPIHVIPLGFDSLHFKKLESKRKVPQSVCSWSVGPAKFENRKRHLKTIKLLIKKFGNKPQHIINLAITNPFLTPEVNQQILGAIFDNKPKPFNVNLVGYMPSNVEVNDFLNFTDIIVNMSGAEGWSLPDFNSVCLGKHAIVHNNTGMKEWVDESVATLVEPETKISAVDNMFFHAGGDFNQGNIFDYSEEEFLAKLDVVYEKWKSNPINEAGLKLADKFAWKNTVDKILEIV